MPSSNALTCGMPHTNTRTLRITHGVHALDDLPPREWPAASQPAPGRSRRPGRVPESRTAARRAGTARARPSTRPPRRRPRARARGSSRRGTAGPRTTTPATRMAGQTSSMPRKPANAQISQNGTITREERQLPADHRAQVEQVESGHALQRDDRRAERAERDRRGVGDERQPRRRQRREAQPDQHRAGHGDRRAESRRALEERAEAERDEQELQPAVASSRA